MGRVYGKVRKNLSEEVLRVLMDVELTRKRKKGPHSSEQRAQSTCGGEGTQ